MALASALCISPQWAKCFQVPQGLELLSTRLGRIGRGREIEVISTIQIIFVYLQRNFLIPNFKKNIFGVERRRVV
jgi:hypothetical protein